MSTPLDQQIVDALAALLKQVRKGNGYRTDAGQFVMTEETREPIPAEAMSVEILDITEQLQDQRIKRRLALLSMDLRVLLPIEAVNPRTTMRAVLADLRQAIATINDVPAWLPGVTRVDLGGRSIPTRTDGSQYLEASLELRVTYNETH